MLRIDVPAGNYLLTASMSLLYLPGTEGGSRRLNCGLLSGTQNRVVLARAGVYLDDSGQMWRNNVPLQAVIALSQPETVWVACSAVDQVEQDQLRVYAVSGNLTALTVDTLTLQ